jgi:DNA-binding MarR family transcriptional regulator
VTAESDIYRVGSTCSTATDGRRAIRALGEWAGRFDVAEPEFQVLWSLRWGPAAGLDQTTLAKKLAYSPAQISATVERLRSRGWISQRPLPGDRRRHLWQLSAEGHRLIEQMLAAAGYLRCLEISETSTHATDSRAREAAA